MQGCRCSLWQRLLMLRGVPAPNFLVQLSHVRVVRRHAVKREQPMVGSEAVAEAAQRACWLTERWEQVTVVRLLLLVLRVVVHAQKLAACIARLHSEVAGDLVVRMVDRKP
eukprot:359985-Chlamydomonas_euryale.AAC.17